MRIRVLDKFGGRPIDLPASAVLICADNGTPMAVAGEYGISGAVKAAIAGDKDFVSVLQTFGFNSDVIVDHMRAPGSPPAGSQLVAGPTR